MALDRLPHGYSNGTRLVDGIVEKRHQGPNAASLAQTEAALLTALAGVLPAPNVIAFDEGEPLLRMSFMDGSNGQALLGGSYTDDVLFQCGQFARRISSVDTARVQVALGCGPVLVHGDYGPHNLLFSPDAKEIVGIVDWEFARCGAASEDIAWAEWIIRHHHPGCLASISALFDGYGERPDWDDRHGHMLLNCQRGKQRAVARGNTKVIASWLERIEQTRQFKPL